MAADFLSSAACSIWNPPAAPSSFTGKGIVHTLQRLLKPIRARVPDSVLRYLLVLVGVLAIAIPLYLHFQYPAPRNAVIGSTLTLGLLLLILACAWLGY